MYGDIKAELIMTMPDGYRLTPQSFTIPTSSGFDAAFRLLNQTHELETLKLRTEIAKLERQLDEALKPKPLKWWQRKCK